MEFMTKEYVKQEAAKGDLEALRCSLLHHEQGRDATRGQLIDALEDKKFALGWASCACCERFNNEDSCKKCPLGHSLSTCCESLYSLAEITIITFEGNPSNYNHKAFKDAESKVCDYIQGVIDDLEKKKEKQIAEEKKPEVTYSIGDRFDYGGEERMLINIDDKVYMLDMKNGTRANSIPDVDDPYNVTVEEFERLGTITFYARTYDARKQCKC